MRNLARVAVVLVRGYQWWVGPALPTTCRFYPSCSNYALGALERHGLLRGLALTAWRLLRRAPAQTNDNRFPFLRVRRL